MVDDLSLGARVALFAGCKLPIRHIRNACLENASYTAIHYGLGPIHDVTLTAVAIKSGFLLGILQRGAP
jgi:hypothetical protein